MRMTEFSAKSFVSNVLNCDDRIINCHIYFDPQGESHSCSIIAGSFLHKDKELSFFTYFDPLNFNKLEVLQLINSSTELYDSFCNNNVIEKQDELYGLCFARNFFSSGGILPGTSHYFYPNTIDFFKSNDNGCDLFDRFLNYNLYQFEDRTSYRAELLA